MEVALFPSQNCHLFELDDYQSVILGELKRLVLKAQKQQKTICL
jgi:hypothetical protein